MKVVNSSIFKNNTTLIKIFISHYKPEYFLMIPVIKTNIGRQHQVVPQTELTFCLMLNIVRPNCEPSFLSAPLRYANNLFN